METVLHGSHEILKQSFHRGTSGGFPITSTLDAPRFASPPLQPTERGKVWYLPLETLVEALTAPCSLFQFHERADEQAHRRRWQQAAIFVISSYDENSPKGYLMWWRSHPPAPET